MSHPELETELNRIYEGEGLTDELMDDEANLLLEWGASQIKTLAEQDGDFAGKAEELRRMMKRINALIGLRDNHTPEEQQDWLNKVAESAHALALPIRQEHIAAFLQEQDTLDVNAGMKKLLAMLNPIETAVLPDTPVQSDTTTASDSPALPTASAVLQAAQNIFQTAQQLIEQQGDKNDEEKQ